MTHDLRDRRIDYDQGLLGDDLPRDPFALFGAWFDDAARAQEEGRLFEATAMTVATVEARSDLWQPVTRVVLLKSWDEQGFVFFTNYASAKGQALAENPACCLHFHWPELHRQVGIEGLAAPVPRTDSEEYFAMRPRTSQVGAWASQQSAPVADRAAMEQAYAEVEARFGSGEVPCPPSWGGYLVVPERMEFWQGRPSRFHDRFVFERSGDGWGHQRLQP